MGRASPDAGEFADQSTHAVLRAPKDYCLRVGESIAHTKKAVPKRSLSQGRGYCCPMRWALRDSTTADGGIAEVEDERAQECFVAGFGEPGHRGREFGQGRTGDSVAVRARVVD